MAKPVAARSKDSLLRLLAAVQTRERVSGLTHSFYRYPARFSPVFARAAIEVFSDHGDVVLDPFMGGGTTLVESQALGRRGVGTDISSLATFIARVKTTHLTKADRSGLLAWADHLQTMLNTRRRTERPLWWIEEGYQRNISGKSTWPIRKALELGVQSVRHLTSRRQQRFARCALLRTGQWALDCRTRTPSAAEFRARLRDDVIEMVTQMEAHWQACCSARPGQPEGKRYGAVCLNRSAVGIEHDCRVAELAEPKLVLTSPPYPGVHVLYHRWQVHGRRETPAPFWIAGCLDGQGASHYTFGDRKSAGLVGYYEGIRASFRSVVSVSGPDSLVVQMVAFSRPNEQLPRYLETLAEAGLTEEKVPLDTGSPDGRLWREVPNRKWYASTRGDTPSNREVVLFHRPVRT